MFARNNNFLEKNKVNHNTKDTRTEVITTNLVKPIVNAWQSSLTKIQREIIKPQEDMKKIIDKALDKSIYIYPWQYKKLKPVLKKISRSQNERGAIKDNLKGKHSKRFYILSHQSADSTKGKICVEVTHETGELLKALVQQMKEKDWKYEELLDCGYVPKPANPNYIFNNDIPGFLIGGIVFKIRRNSTIYAICKLILEDEASVKRIWELDEIVDRIGEDFTRDKNWYDIIYQKIRPLNAKIAKLTGLKQFFLINNTTVQVNPQYLMS